MILTDISKTVSSCFNRLVHINRIKHLLDKPTLLLLIKSYVFTKLFYCSSVRANTSQANIHKLQLAQNFAVRIILGLRKFDHISEGLNSLGMLKVKDRLEINDLAPKYLGDQLQMRSSVCTRVTRSANNLNIPRCRLVTGQRRFAYRAVKIWNGLSNDLRTLDCKTVVFSSLFGAKRRKRDPRVWSARASHALGEFLASLPILPRRFYTRSRPFVRIDCVARVRKKYDCFAVYEDFNKLTYIPTVYI